MRMPRRSLNKRIRIERPLTDDAWDGAGSGQWELVAVVSAEVRDDLPSKGERTTDGVNLSARPARVRMDRRTDIDPSMRFVMGDRIMQIVSGPADVERPQATEFKVEEWKPAGNPA